MSDIIDLLARSRCALSFGAMTPEQLDGAFFSELFGVAVRSVTQERIGDGLIGMNVRCGLAHDAADVPRSVVVKLPSPDATSRATGLALGNYEREVRFYDELAITLSVRAPRCYYSQWDGAAGDFALVLQDLSPAVVGDQLTGTTVARCRLALSEAASLHASRWDDPALHDMAWLQRRTPDDAARVVGLYQLLWPGFVERYGPGLSTDQLRHGAEVGERLAQWIGNRAEPWCVTHGDFRLDNLMFGDDGATAAVWAVDWQTPGHGPALSDVSYFMGAGLVTDDRRVHERELVEYYRSELAHRGVTMTADECWAMYRRESVAGVVVTVVASMVTGDTDRSRRLFATMADRHLTHVADCAPFN
jgi:Phosphotransferase enzyme family